VSSTPDLFFDAGLNIATVLIPPTAHFERGYGWMFWRHILQAGQGCDFDFLQTEFGGPVEEPAIYLGDVDHLIEGTTPQESDRR
jgi:hypothetical protein